MSRRHPAEHEPAIGATGSLAKAAIYSHRSRRATLGKADRPRDGREFLQLKIEISDIAFADFNPEHGSEDTRTRHPRRLAR